MTSKKKKTDEQIRLDKLDKMFRETRELLARCEHLIEEMPSLLRRAEEQCLVGIRIKLREADVNKLKRESHD